MFVIAGRIKGEENYQYLAVEYSYFWTDFMGPNMCKFKTYEDAQHVLKNNEFTRCDIFSDGIKYPPQALQKLSSCNINKMSEDVEIFIMEIDLCQIYKTEYHCEIKKPTKTIYEYDE